MGEMASQQTPGLPGPIHRYVHAAPPPLFAARCENAAQAVNWCLTISKLPQHTRGPRRCKTAACQQPRGAISFPAIRGRMELEGREGRHRGSSNGMHGATSGLLGSWAPWLAPCRPACSAPHFLFPTLELVTAATCRGKMAKNLDEKHLGGLDMAME